MSLLAVSAPAAREPIVLSPGTAQQTLQTEQIGHRLTGQGTETVGAIQRLEESAFQPLPHDAILNEPGDHWLRFSVRNPSPERVRWTLAIDWGTIDLCSLWDVSVPGSPPRLSGDMIAYDERAHPWYMNAFPIALGPGETHELVLLVRNTTLTKAQIVAWEPEALTQVELDRFMGWMLITGIIFAFVVYNAFHFVLLRDRSYLYFVSYLLLAATYIVAVTGIGPRHLWPSASGVNNLLTTRVGLLSVLAVIAFLRRFLSTPAHHPRYDRILRGFWALAAVFFVVTFWLPHAFAVKATVALIGVLPLISVPLIVSAVRRGFVPARYLLVAYGGKVVVTALFAMSMAVPAVVRAFLNEKVGAIAASFMAAEAVLLSFGLAARMKVLEGERSRLQGAQVRMQQLMETAGEALIDVDRWAQRLAGELAKAMGVRDIGVWAVSNSQVIALSDSGNGKAPTLHELTSLVDRRARPEDVTSTDEVRFPVRGPSGELLGGLVVRGADPQRWGDSERQLLVGFAHQLGNALELRKAQQSLIRAESRRALSRQQLIDKGVQLLRLCPHCQRCYPHTADECEIDFFPLNEAIDTPYRIDDRYRLTSLLGEGGMGAVYAAQDDKVGREVAIKLLPPQIMADASVRHRFSLEVKLLGRLSHPFIVRLYDSGEVDGGSSYLVMELLKGEPLSSVIKRDGRGTPRQIAALLRQIASALGAAHRIGIIHRDIKPENVIVLEETSGARFTAKLLDFGVAKSADTDEKLTRTGLAVGTPRYMSPEQSRGLPLDSRSDLYSLAMVVLEAINGQRLHLGDSLAEIMINIFTKELPAVSSLLPGWPRELDAVFADALAKDPAKRPQDMEAWANRIADALEKVENSVSGWSARHNAKAAAQDDPTVTRISSVAS